jgi:hypothetical protein
MIRAQGISLEVCIRIICVAAAALLATACSRTAQSPVSSTSALTAPVEADMAEVVISARADRHDPRDEGRPALD